MTQPRIVVERLPEGVYLATSPDLPGLIVEMETEAAARALALELAAELVALQRQP